MGLTKDRRTPACVMGRDVGGLTAECKDKGGAARRRAYPRRHQPLILRREAKPSLKARSGGEARPSRPAARAPRDEELWARPPAYREQTAPHLDHARDLQCIQRRGVQPEFTKDLGIVLANGLRRWAANRTGR